MLVTIDTLRADRLGAYGNTTVATPNLDRLAREGAMALHTSAQVPLTRPSHVSILTGLYPAEHGIRDNVSPPLRPGRAACSPRSCKRRGFRTGAFVSSIVLSKQSGLGRGFETYSDRFEIGDDDARFLNTIQKRGDATVAEAAAWLREPGSERRFAWVHLYDPHDPYEPPEPYATRYADRPYDGEVAWSDDLVGRLDAVLAETGLRDDTLLVVTADHGEGLDEHGEAVHGFFVYETTLHVPLIVARPAGDAGHQESRASPDQIDVMPTVLDLLGLADATPAVSGRIVGARALTGSALTDEPTFAESLTPLIHYGWSDLRALRDGRWKYILAPRPESVRPRSRPRRAQEPRRRRAEARARVRSGSSSSSSWNRPHGAAPSLPPRRYRPTCSRSWARSGTSAAAPRRSERRARIPKDKIEEYKILNTLMREGLVSLREKRYADSLARFQSLFGHGVDSFESHYYAARALTGMKRWREAAVHYEGAITKLPSYTAAYLGLADADLADGKVDQALDSVRRGQKAAPDDPRLIEREGDIERREGGATRPPAPTSAWRRWPRATRSSASSWARYIAIRAAGGRGAGDARGDHAGPDDGSVLERPWDGARRSG